MNVSNSSILVELLTEEEFSLKTKVCVGLIAPILAFLITFLNFGIAYFERFGIDSQKRNLYNMMLSSFCMGVASFASFWVVFVSIRIICGTFDISNAFAFIATLSFFQMFNGLCILEAIVHRLLAIYYPKTIIGINDDWFHHFFNYLNVIMALIHSLTTKWTITPGSLLENIGYPNGYFVSLLIGQEQNNK